MKINAIRRSIICCKLTLIGKGFPALDGRERWGWGPEGGREHVPIFTECPVAVAVHQHGRARTKEERKVGFFDVKHQRNTIILCQVSSVNRTCDSWSGDRGFDARAPAPYWLGRCQYNVTG